MKEEHKIWEYCTLSKLATRLRDDLNSMKAVLLFAYNGTGKTRLSMEFKDIGKKHGTNDTLYFNAYTEDLFFWDNDLKSDTDYYIYINSESKFFSCFKELSLEGKIFPYLERYTDLNFKIDYDQWRISFYRQKNENIKISRGEEKIFIWCIFLAICTLVVDEHESYSWVKYIYIDDPISSLDDNNAISIAVDLSNILKNLPNEITYIISSHHSLFFNVIWNEFKGKIKYNTYFLYKSTQNNRYSLQRSGESPFLHHIAMLHDLQQAVQRNEIYTYHFNTLRSIMEKTAIFFGYENFSSCVHSFSDKDLYNRALNLLSHGKYSVYSPYEMVDDTKEIFKQILTAFLSHYQFELPKLYKESQPTNINTAKEIIIPSETVDNPESSGNTI